MFAEIPRFLFIVLQKGNHDLRSKLSQLNNKYFCIVVSFSWILGFLIGVAIDFLLRLLGLDQTNSLNGVSASFFGILFSSVAPIALTVLFAVQGFDLLLIIAVFLKAIVHGYSSLVLYTSQNLDIHTGGCLFSQSCCCILMLFSCFYLHDSPSDRRIFICPVILSALTICLMDFYIFSV